MDTVSAVAPPFFLRGSIFFSFMSVGERISVVRCLFIEMCMVDSRLRLLLAVLYNTRLKMMKNFEAKGAGDFIWHYCDSHITKILH